MSSSGLDIRTRGGVLVVAPVGDIDLTNAAELRTAILAAVDNAPAGVVVDLSATHYIDSAGIRVLFSVARRMHERRRELALVVPAGAHLRRVLSIVDMDGSVPVYETNEAARRELER